MGNRNHWTRQTGEIEAEQTREARRSSDIDETREKKETGETRDMFSLF